LTFSWWTFNSILKHALTFKTEIIECTEIAIIAGSNRVIWERKKDATLPKCIAVSSPVFTYGGVDEAAIEVSNDAWVLGDNLLALIDFVARGLSNYNCY
jgi:hypothetical protein